MSLSYSFEIERINTLLHARSSLETIPDSSPKWAKSISLFKPKRRKNPGAAHTYLAYIGVYLPRPPPPPPPG